MIIRPSAAIRQNYNEIADMCRKTKSEGASHREAPSQWIFGISGQITS